MYYEFVPEEVVWMLVSVSLPILLTGYLTARRVMRLIMRQRMLELVFMERLALLRRGLIGNGAGR